MKNKKYIVVFSLEKNGEEYWLILEKEFSAKEKYKTTEEKKELLIKELGEKCPDYKVLEVEEIIPLPKSVSEWFLVTSIIKIT